MEEIGGDGVVNGDELMMAERGLTLGANEALRAIIWLQHGTTLFIPRSFHE